MNNKDFEKFAKDRFNVPSLTLNDYENHIVDNYIEPTIVEERKLNATQISVFSRLFMERILFLGTGINSDVANIINSQLLYLEMDDPAKPVTIYINSPGGSVADGLSIYDMFHFIQCPVHTVCMGTAASMAAVLLSSGDKGYRKALENSRVMIHQPSGGTGRVTAADMEINYQEMMKCKNTLYSILANNMGKTAKEVAKLCDRDRWYSADEAVKDGLIDGIIERRK